MPEHLSNIKVRRVSFVARGSVRDPSNPSEPQRRLLWKAEERTGPSTDPVPTDAQGGTNMDNAELQAALQKAEQERDQAKTDLAKSEQELEKAKKTPKKPDEEDEDENPLNKSDLPEPVRKALQKAEDDRQTAIAKAEEAGREAKEANDLAKAEREERVSAEFIQKAEAFKGLPTEPSQFGPLLKEANEKLSKENYDELQRVLKAADAGLTEGELFKEQGRAGGGRPPESDTSAAAEVTRKAEELRKSETDLSMEQAKAKVMKGDRDLQARYLAENR